MNIQLETILAILGGKELDIFLLKQEIESLRKRLSEAEAKLAETER